ncbi:purine-cytosine permease family protein [Hydromonas duriensis]|uniref:Purine-cytosine permease-like protein n=1 Tax=Hydromonas duriensis TaxID=1527608 RepID=A0A4R6Y8T6_9BURK|nr:allantoin permease [Hydromonas duriensis]TDR31849.1 purine-cytosine permease-like protein [Hydromonas duriensis]
MAANIPNVVEDVDVATLAIPDDMRSSRSSLTMAWWGVCSALFYIFLAATLAINFGTQNTIIGMLLSVVAYGLINSVLTRYAIKTGLSVSLFSRILFGKVGALLATLIFFLTAIYYAVFEGSVIAVAANKVIPNLSYEWACVLVVLYSVPLVFGSVQHWLDKLNGFLLPFYIFGLLLAVVMTVGTYGYSNDWLSFEPQGGAASYGWISVFIAYMGVWILMMFTFDFARFGAKQDTEYHARINFGMPFYVMTFLINGLVGIFLITSGQLATVSETGVVDQLIVVLGGGLALLFVWVTQTRINSANFYLATVNMQAFFEKLLGVSLKKWMWAILVGVVVLVMMRSTDVFSYILTALNYQGIFVTAWVGVALTHILSKRYDQLFDGALPYHSNQVPNFNPCGLAAWFIGSGMGLLMTLTGIGAAYAPVATFLFSVGVYYGMLQIAHREWFATVE